MGLMEKYSHKGEGYNPFLVGPSWQIAQLNYSPSEDIENKCRLDVHDNTDEAFLLMEGDAVLIAAEIEGSIISYDIVKMEPNVVYNIPRKVWHNIALKPDAKVLIVENAGTHLPLPQGDYRFHVLCSPQKAELKELVRAAF